MLRGECRVLSGEPLQLISCAFIKGHGADVKCVHWHPHKGMIVSGSKDNQQPIKIWDPKSGIALATL